MLATAGITTMALLVCIPSPPDDSNLLQTEIITAKERGEPVVSLTLRTYRIMNSDIIVPDGVVLSDVALDVSPHRSLCVDGKLRRVEIHGIARTLMDDAILWLEGKQSTAIIRHSGAPTDVRHIDWLDNVYVSGFEVGVLFSKDSVKWR
jgi:hypothetical protein